MGRLRSTCLLVFAVSLAGGCTAGGSRMSAPTGAVSSPAVSSPAVTAAAAGGCGDSVASGFVERQGEGEREGVTLWALLFPPGPGPAIVAQREIKIVWRMTGRGDLSITASGPGGATVKPVWGPEPHSSSSWTRPGEEWGTGWVFPTAGCWTVHARRSAASARLVLAVA